MQLEQFSQINTVDNKNLEILKNPQRSITVNFPLKMDNGEIKLITGFRVQYNDALGPTKGGLRFHQTINQDEVSELAFLMSLKTSLAGLPYGGAKGGVKINPKELSEGELERVARGFMRAIASFIGVKKDIPAPDVNTNPKIMGWMRDEYEKIVGHPEPGIITGKNLDDGGSQGRETSTARGAFFIIEEMFREVDKSQQTVAIQGFGNVGLHLADFLSKMGFKIVAVSDSQTGIYNPRGLEVNKLIQFKRERQSFIKFPAEKISNDKLLGLEVDILAPSALGGVIKSVNVEEIKAKTIIELANAPISAEADRILTEKGVVIIPDILANSGGVIVSYFEWVQNLENKYWTAEEVDTKLKNKILTAYQKVAAETKSQNISHRLASYSIAIRRIIDAEKERGAL